MYIQILFLFISFGFPIMQNLLEMALSMSVCVCCVLSTSTILARTPSPVPKVHHKRSETCHIQMLWGWPKFFTWSQ